MPLKDAHMKGERYLHTIHIITRRSCGLSRSTTEITRAKCLISLNLMRLFQITVDTASTGSFRLLFETLIIPKEYMIDYIWQCGKLEFYPHHCF